MAARTTLTRRWKATVGDHVLALEWSPDGGTLAAAAVSGPVTLFDPAGTARHTLPGHGFGTTALSWRRDGSLLATAGQDGKVRLWDAATGTERAACPGGAAWVEHVTWHPVADVLASAAGKKLRLWTPDGTLLREYPDHPATIADLAWRPGTNDLTSATYGGVALRGIDTSEATRRMAWQGSILALAWSPDGAHLAHGNQNATVHFWTLATGDDLEMAGYALKVRDLCWDCTGRYLATGGAEAVTVWDCTPPGPEGSEPLTFEGHEGGVTALAYQTRGPLLASGGQGGVVLLLQPGKFQKPVAKSQLDAGVTRLAWSPNDRLLAAATEAGGVVVYSAG